MIGNRMRAFFRNEQTKEANCYYNCYFAPPVFTDDVNVQFKGWQVLP